MLVIMWELVIRAGEGARDLNCDEFKDPVADRPDENSPLALGDRGGVFLVCGLEISGVLERNPPWA
jgi:hypothetical protein